MLETKVFDEIKGDYELIEVVNMKKLSKCGLKSNQRRRMKGP